MRKTIYDLVRWMGCLFVATIVFTMQGYAQSETRGEVVGYVYQESNPAKGIANARVTMTDLQTGAPSYAVTDANGFYRFSSVRPSYFEITVEAPNYVTAGDRSKIARLDVPATKAREVKAPPLYLRDATSVTPTTTVAPPPATTQAPRIAVSANGATRSYSYDADVLLALPLFGNRSFDQLALLAAGVAPAPQAVGDTVGPGVGSGVGTSGQFAVNGLRSRANNFTVDGSDNNDEDIGVRRQGFTALVPQSIESVQSFTVITLLPRAQFGRNLGAQVNAVSRGGTKNLHGMLFGFLTDSRLKARDAFDLTGGPATFPLKRTSDGKPVLLDGKPLAPANPVKGESPFTRAQYGFVVSGPAAKKNAFFFGSYERRDLNALKEANFAVPTVAERGLFGSGETGLIVNAGGFTRDVFPTGVDGDTYFSLFPFPNNPRGPYGANTFTELLPASADGTIFSVKLERNFKAFDREHTLTGRYNFTDDATKLPVTGEALFSTLNARVRTQNLSLFLNSIFSPVLSHEARFSYGRTRLGFDEVRNPFLLPSRLKGVPFLLNAPKLANSTLPTPSELCAATCYDARGFGTEVDTDVLGQVLVSGFSPVGVDVFNFPQARVNNTFQAANTLIRNWSRHQLIVGGDFRYTQLNSRLDRNFRSQAVFGGTMDVARRFGAQPLIPSGRPSGFYLGSDFVAVGAATGFNQTLTLTPDSTVGLRFWQNNLFASEQISVKPNFKVTLGLRYELNTVPQEANRRIESSFNTAEVAGFIAEEKRRFGASGFEQYLAGRSQIYAGDRNNFAPNLGFAWAPWKNGRSVVRGGYGIYYDQLPGAIISQSRSVFPRFLTINLAGVSPTGAAIAFNPQRLSRAGTLNVYDPNNSFQLGRNLLEFLLSLNRAVPLRENYFPAGPGFVLPTADLVTPYAQHWNLSVEHQLSQELFVSLGYVGTRGTRLLRQATPNLGANAIQVITNGVLSGNEIVFQGVVVSPGRDVQQGTNFRRPFPLLGAFTSIESDANSSYHSLQAEATLKLQQLQVSLAYTWSHAIDEISDFFALAGARNLPQNSFNRRAERGSANFDLRHRFTQSFIWDVPFWKQHKLLGGWQLAGIVTLQTGQPFT